MHVVFIDWRGNFRPEVAEKEDLTSHFRTRFTTSAYYLFSISDSVHPVLQDPLQHFSWRSGGGVSVPRSGPCNQPSPEDGRGGAKAAGAEQPPRVHKACQHRCCCGGVFNRRSLHHPGELRHLRLPQQSGCRARPHRDRVVVFVWAGPGFSAQRAGHSHFLWKACRRSD